MQEASYAYQENSLRRLRIGGQEVLGAPLSVAGALPPVAPCWLRTGLGTQLLCMCVCVGGAMQHSAQHGPEPSEQQIMLRSGLVMHTRRATQQFSTIHFDLEMGVKLGNLFQVVVHQDGKG